MCHEERCTTDSTKAARNVRPELAGTIKQVIEQEPSFGYHTVTAPLGMSQNTALRICQLMSWQVRKRRWAAPADSGATTRAWRIAMV